MRIAIIAAMDKEVALLLNLMPDHSEVEADGLKFRVGEISGKTISVAKCGIGKVNSAVNTYRLIKAFQPDLVINSGVAGSVDEQGKIGDVLVSDGIVYHDVWCGPGTLIGAADGFPQILTPDDSALKVLKRLGEGRDDFHASLIATGDIFVSEPEQVAAIKSKFPSAIGCDMESGAIAQTCMMTETPFIIVRVLSDRPGSGDNISEYKNFWSIAPEKTFEIVEQLIKEL